PAKMKPQSIDSQAFETPQQRADSVQYLRLCPRRLQLYVAEAFTLVPLPLDRNRQTVHGAAMTWSSSDANVATITSYGEVSAKSAGHTLVTLQVGSKRANVVVQVELGPRPRITDQEWDRLHAQDCDNPEAAELIITDSDKQQRAESLPSTGQERT